MMEFHGSIGASKHIEAIQLELTGNLTNYYYLDYNVHTYYNSFSFSNVNATSVLDKNIGITDKFELLSELPGWDVDSYGEIVRDSNFAGTYMCALPLVGYNVQIYDREIDLTINPNGGIYENSTNSKKIAMKVNSQTNISTPTRKGYVFNGWTLTHTADETVSSKDNNYQPATSNIEGTLNKESTIYTSGNMNAVLTANWIPVRTLTVNCVDIDGNLLQTSSSEYTQGENYETKAPNIDGYSCIYSTDNTSGTIGTENIIVIYTYQKLANLPLPEAGGFALDHLFFIAGLLLIALVLYRTRKGEK